MRHNSIKTGNLAESIARTYFIKAGYEVFPADYHTQTADLITRDIHSGELTAIDVKTFDCRLTANGDDLIVWTGGSQYKTINKHQTNGIQTFACVRIGDEFFPLGWFEFDARKGTYFIEYIDGAHAKAVQLLNAEQHVS